MNQKMKQLISAASESKAVSVAIAVMVGAAIGFGAWGEGRYPYLAALLPLAIGISGTRLRAFAIGFAYVLATERAGPAFMASWFDDSLIAGLALWLGSGLVGGLVWSLGWTASATPWRKALASVTAWAVTLLPPVAVLAMGHPIIAWGNIMQGTGWLGVIASCAVPAIILWNYSKAPWSLWTMTLMFVPIAGAVVGASAYSFNQIETRFVGDMAAVSTNWGAAKDPWEVLERIERIGNTDVRVVIYPEAVIQRYDPALYQVLKMEVIDAAARAGQTIILGADLPTKGGDLESAAIAFYPDGKSATAIARQTVPIALWKPWLHAGSFLTDWRANNILTLKDGVVARVLFCYEEYIPLLSLINEAKDAHNIVVVMANTWAAKDQLASTIQSRHSEGIAKLFGKRILRAENRPKKER
jgi:hypothetical protein